MHDLDATASGTSTLAVSAALEQVARPLLDAMPQERGITGTRTIFLLTAASWNVSVCHPPERADMELQTLCQDFMKDTGGFAEDTLAVLRRLAARKRELYPADHRLVLSVEVVDEGDHFYVTAISAPWRPSGQDSASTPPP
jgi:hypothetical protein